MVVTGVRRIRWPSRTSWKSRRLACSFWGSSPVSKRMMTLTSTNASVMLWWELLGEVILSGLLQYFLKWSGLRQRPGGACQRFKCGVVRHLARRWLGPAGLLPSWCGLDDSHDLVVPREGDSQSGFLHLLSKLLQLGAGRHINGFCVLAHQNHLL